MGRILSVIILLIDMIDHRNFNFYVRAAEFAFLRTLAYCGASRSLSFRNVAGQAVRIGINRDLRAGLGNVASAALLVSFLASFDAGSVFGSTCNFLHVMAELRNFLAALGVRATSVLAEIFLC